MKAIILLIALMAIAACTNKSSTLTDGKGGHSSMLIIWLRPDLNPNRSTGVQRLRQGDSGARIALIPCYLADVTPRCHVHPKHAVSS